jgi:dTMP kinase
MFITFEGPEGSGKSSQLALLAPFLVARGVDVLVTREPGGTAIGDQIRLCLHDVANNEMTAATELLLYSASRAQLVREIIQPALAAGKLVLCDRFADSTLAYQGYGRGLDIDNLHTITRFATGGLAPDLTFLLDIDVAHGLARRRECGAEMNRLDLEQLAFHERVRQGYYELMRADAARWCIIDADRPVDAVQQDIRTTLLERLIRLPSPWAKAG